MRTRIELRADLVQCTNIQSRQAADYMHRTSKEIIERREKLLLIHQPEPDAAVVNLAWERLKRSGKG